jgi:hypothetical protein
MRNLIPCILYHKPWINENKKDQMTVNEASTKYIRTVYKILVDKCEGTVQFWRLILLMMFEETGSESVNWTPLAVAREQWLAL